MARFIKRKPTGINMSMAAMRYVVWKFTGYTGANPTVEMANEVFRQHGYDAMKAAAEEFDVQAYLETGELRAR